MGSDLAAIGGRLLPFGLAAGVVIILAGSRFYPLAWGILAVAIIYALMYGRGASFLGDVNAIFKGSKK